jgi:hypothetical protein
MKTKPTDRDRLEKLNKDIDLLDKLRNDLSDIRDEMQSEGGFVPDSWEKKTPEMVRRKLVSETDEDEEDDDDETVIVHRSSSHKTANPDEIYKDIMKEDKRRRKMGKD